MSSNVSKIIHCSICGDFTEGDGSEEEKMHLQGHMAVYSVFRGDYNCPTCGREYQTESGARTCCGDVW